MPATDSETGSTNRIVELEQELARTKKKLKSEASERKKSLEYQAATARILEIIRRTPADSAPVFQAICESAAQLFDAPICHVFRSDGRFLDFVAWHGLAAEAIEEMRRTYPIAVSRGTVAGRAILSGRTEEIPDSSVDTDYQWRELAELGGYRSLIGVPILKDSQPLGVIVTGGRSPGTFSQRQIALLKTFADQAVIAIENARLFAAEQERTRELQESLEYQTATSDVLGVISRSPNELQPVLDAIAERAARLCEATDAVVLLRSRDRLAHRAHFGPILLDVAELGLSHSSVSARCVVERKTIHLHDIQTEREAYSEGCEIAKRVGYHTVLGVPLMRHNEAIGSLVLRRMEIRSFSEKQIGLVRTFADQAVIAIENARLFEAEQVKTRELNESLIHQSAAAEVLETISASPGSVEPVYEAILARTLQHCDSRFGVLLRPSNEGYRLAAHLGLPEELVDVLAKTPFVPVEGTGIARAIAAGAPAQSPDIQNVELYPDPGAARTDAFRTAVANLGGGRSAVSVPLMKDGELVGVFIIFRTQVQPFSDKQVALLKTFADQAVIAIENARLFEQVQERSRALSELNQSLEERVNAQVNELERMGRLKRFLSPAVVDAVISSGDERLLSSHRALIAVLFADIRGFTAFCETAEPEETIEVLQTYHEAMGELLGAHNVGVDQRSGDGIMAIFNDPLPCDDPAGDAVRLALVMRERMQILCARWKRLGHHLGFGVGITLGYATVGLVGSEGRYDYTASGTTVNLAARLCDEAADGEILLSPRACTAVEDHFETTHHGAISFKGIQVPVEVHRLIGLKNS